MPESENNASQLQIRCPNCGQRFKVGPELRSKLVECGSCERRFRVEDDVILRSRKFYPGEAKNDAHLERFPRAALHTTSQIDFQTANYNPAPNPEMVEPPSFQRVLAGVIGAGLLVFVLLLFVLSTGGGGPLASVSTERRLVLAVFISVIGSAFIIYANRRKLLPALAGCGLASLALVAMAIIFPGPDDAMVHQPPPPLDTDGERPRPPVKPDNGDQPENPADPYAKLKEEMRYGPVAAEIVTAGSPEKVTAIWLRGMRERHKWTVEEYLLRTTGADRSSHLYRRGDTAHLMVLTGMNQDIEATAHICKRIGNVERVVRPLRVIEVMVSGDRFAEAPIERLRDTGSDAFYALNLKELESIDLGRVERAVERLSNAEPKQFRSDIVERLIAILDEAPLDLCEDVAVALGTWSEPGDGADQAVLALALKMDESGKKLGEGIIGFLVDRSVAEVQPILHKRWLDNPDSWEQIYGKLGEPARGPMLAALAEENISIRDSAVRILGRVGNTASIPILEALKNGKDSELDLNITRAIAHIRERKGQPDVPKAEPVPDPPPGP